MNKKPTVLVVLALSILVLTLSMATPALASSPKRMPVTITTNAFFFETPTETMTVGNTLHGKGGVSGYGSFIITGEGIDLQGSSLSTIDLDINLRNGKGLIHEYSVLTFEGGVFEAQICNAGVFTGLVSGLLVPPDLMKHAVYIGKGDYQGWTLSVLLQDGVIVQASMLIP
jgi:hypothetical protein